MALDQTQNFVYDDVAEAVSSTETTIDVNDASVFPDPANGNYNVVIWDYGTYSEPHRDPDVEIMRVTGRDTTNNNITVSRGQENTSGVSHPSTSRIHLPATSKMFTDIDSNKLERSGDTMTGILDLNGNDLEDSGTTIWDTSGTHIEQSVLENDSITFNAGDGLKNGSTAALGGTFGADIEPADFAGSYLSDDGSDNLQVNLGNGLAGDGNDNIEIPTSAIGTNELDLSINPTWTGSHTFSSNVDFNGNSLVNIGGTTDAGSGAIRLANLSKIAWRNSADANDHYIWFEDNDDFEVAINGGIEYRISSGGNHVYEGNSLTEIGGVSDASSGAIRLANNAEINTRDSGNANDVGLIKANTSDVVQLAYNSNASGIDLFASPNFQGNNLRKIGGSTDANSGAIRLANNVGIYQRDSGNGSDILLAKTFDNDRIQFGNGNAAGITLNPGTDTIRASGASITQVGGTTDAGSGAIRAANNVDFAWRNSGDTADHAIRFDGSDNLEIDIGGSRQLLMTGVALSLEGQILTEVGGSTDAGSGVIRLPNNQQINARNSGDSGDLTLIASNGSDDVFVNHGRNFSVQQSGTEVFTVVGTSGTNFRGGDLFQVGGTTAASTGAVRLANATGIYARNSADSGDIRVIDTDGSDNVTIGNSTANSVQLLGGDVRLAGNILTGVGGSTDASAGAIRLANNKKIAWRNSGDTADHSLIFDSNDTLDVNIGGSTEFIFTSALLSLQGGVMTSVGGSTDASSGAIRLGSGIQEIFARDSTTPQDYGLSFNESSGTPSVTFEYSGTSTFRVGSNGPVVTSDAVGLVVNDTNSNNVLTIDSNTAGEVRLFQDASGPINFAISGTGGLDGAVEGDGSWKFSPGGATLLRADASSATVDASSADKMTLPHRTSDPSASAGDMWYRTDLD